MKKIVFLFLFVFYNNLNSGYYNPSNNQEIYQLIRNLELKLSIIQSDICRLNSNQINYNEIEKEKLEIERIKNLSMPDKLMHQHLQQLRLIRINNDINELIELKASLIEIYKVYEKLEIEDKSEKAIEKEILLNLKLEKIKSIDKRVSEIIKNNKFYKKVFKFLASAGIAFGIFYFLKK